MQKVYTQYDVFPENKLFTLKLIDSDNYQSRHTDLSILKEGQFNRGKNLQIFRPKSYEDFYSWNLNDQSEFPDCKIVDCHSIDSSCAKKTWEPTKDVIKNLIEWMHEREIWSIDEVLFDEDNFIDLVNAQTDAILFFGPIRIGHEVIEDLIDYLNVVFYKYIFTFDPYSYYTDQLYNKGYCVKIENRPNSEQYWNKI